MFTKSVVMVMITYINLSPYGYDNIYISDTIHFEILKIPKDSQSCFVKCLWPFHMKAMFSFLNFYDAFLG